MDDLSAADVQGHMVDEKMADINREEAELSQKFSENLLDCTKLQHPIAMKRQAKF